MNEAKSESLKQMKSAGMHHEPEGNIGVLNSNAIFFFANFASAIMKQIQKEIMNNVWKNYYEGTSRIGLCIGYSGRYYTHSGITYLRNDSYA